MPRVNGAAVSEMPGKSRFIFDQWLKLYYTRIDEHLSAQDLSSLPNPTYELAFSLWTEKDPKAKAAVESEILTLFKNDFLLESDRLSRKEKALVYLVTSHIDLCMSKLLGKPCTDELYSEPSLPGRLTDKHLSKLLKRQDAIQLLSQAHDYVVQMSK